MMCVVCGSSASLRRGYRLHSSDLSVRLDNSSERTVESESKLPSDSAAAAPCSTNRGHSLTVSSEYTLGGSFEHLCRWLEDLDLGARCCVGNCVQPRRIYIGLSNKDVSPIL